MKRLLRGECRTSSAIFDSYVSAYDASVPFTTRQFELHRRTIARRRELGSATAALQDDDFMRLLLSTLHAWQLGKRGSKLSDGVSIVDSLRDQATTFEALQGLSLESLPDVTEVVQSLWALIGQASITENKAKVVASFKLLHHLLPDLVPPIDRAYTGQFFSWPDPYFQYRQREIFTEAFATFSEIARKTKPSRLVGDGWRTSSSKIVDNALISFWRLKGAIPGELEPQLLDEPEAASDAPELARLAGLMREANRVNGEIAALVNRPALPGHVGEFIASRIFGIELEESAVRAGFDGHFEAGSLEGASVNIKFYGFLEYLLDIGQVRPDYYLVLTGPTRAAISSRGGTRPWGIEHVFLFRADVLVSALEERGVRVGVATSVRKELWDANRIYPSHQGAPLEITDAQTSRLDLFSTSHLSGG